MRVYRFEGGERQLIGRTDLPEDAGPFYAVPLSGPVSASEERFIIGTVTRVPAGGGGAPDVEQAVLAAPGQPVQLLPGWEPLVCWPF
uniref:hypothetical protein n=1 Tax=uncultured Sphingomonas sp. TaxID=158754 RepID=UPI0025D9DD91|nr:hypothetical protein [uncultured Sphingomonas sp.]